jgi:hypothetical protein
LATDADGAALADASAVGAEAVATGSALVVAGGATALAAGAALMALIFAPRTSPRTTRSSPPATPPMIKGSLLFGGAAPTPKGEPRSDAPSGEEIPIGDANIPPSAIDGGRVDSALAARALRSMRPESSFEPEGGG